MLAPSKAVLSGEKDGKGDSAAASDGGSGGHSPDEGRDEPQKNGEHQNGAADARSSSRSDAAA